MNSPRTNSPPNEQHTEETERPRKMTLTRTRSRAEDGVYGQNTDRPENVSADIKDEDASLTSNIDITLRTCTFPQEVPSNRHAIQVVSSENAAPVPHDDDEDDDAIARTGGFEELAGPIFLCIHVRSISDRLLY
jgi:hypothetical protein